MLSTTYDAPAFRRLETTILSASKENGSRLRKSSDTTSPLERKKSIALPPVYGTPAFFAQASARQSH